MNHPMGDQAITEDVSIPVKQHSHSLVVDLCPFLLLVVAPTATWVGEFISLLKVVLGFCSSTENAIFRCNSISQ